MNTFWEKLFFVCFMFSFYWIAPPVMAFLNKREQKKHSKKNSRPNKKIKWLGDLSNWIRLKYRQLDKPNKFLVNFSLTFVVLFGGGELYRVTTLNFLLKNGVYTIGTLKNISKTQGTYMADCYFSYKGILYNCRATSYEITKRDENKFALIILYPKRPSYHRRFTYYHIPDTITYIPEEGWKEIPSYIYKKE